MLVDVHTHFFPAGLPDFAKEYGDDRWPSLHIDPASEDGAAQIRLGDTVFRSVDGTCWDPARRLAAMDASSIDIHVLTPVPITLTTWAPPEHAMRWAREQNDALAAAAATVPGRYRWMGSVPLQDPTNAVAELTRIATLGASGVEIGSEVDGRELDDSELLPFFRAAAEHNVAVFVHPTDGVGAIRRRGAPYEFGLGMLTDTAMAAGALVFGGVLGACPDLRVGLAHGCGSFPWALPRIARGATLGTPPAKHADHVAATEQLVRRLWADTLVFDPLHLELLIERFGAEHLFLGSDFPFYPPTWGAPTQVIDDCERAGRCTPAQATAMRSANGLTFLGVDQP